MRAIGVSQGTAGRAFAAYPWALARHLKPPWQATTLAHCLQMEGRQSRHEANLLLVPHP